MNTKKILGVGVLACVACCSGPLLALLSAIAALGALSAVLVGAGALLVAAIAVALVLALRRRRCAAPSDVRVELSASRR
jgi:hypothetical protein